MALIRCPDCSTDVSSNADKCMKCGNPISQNVVSCPECESDFIEAKNNGCPECGYPLDRIKRDTKRTTSITHVGGDIPAQASQPNKVTKSQPKETEYVGPQKSFVGSATITFLLYYVGFYIVGLIVNIMYLNECKEIQTRTGVAPSGKGCLSFLLFIHFTLPMIIILIIFLMLVFGVMNL